MLEHMKGATVAGRQRWPKFRSGAEALLSYEMGVWLQLSAPLPERLAVARRARNLPELLEDQLDLLPADRQRWLAAHHERVRHWRSLLGAITRG